MPFPLLDGRIVDHLAERGILEPTEPQRDSIPRILDGQNILVVAPTGIGKTESAVLPILHELLEDPRPGISCVYVTPLRALNRDMLRRMTEYGDALGLRVAVRHGDTTQAERNRQSRHPPDILITTPETLQVMFTGRNLRRHLENVRFLVVDEIHELADDERGAQLSVAMERLSRLAGEYQRIGLSATVGNYEEIARFLGGIGRDVHISRHDLAKDLSITVQGPRPNDSTKDLAGKLQADEELIAGMVRARELIESHRSTLFFVNTRDAAEALSLRYHVWDETFPIGVHHGSLSKEVRVDMEDRFKAEDLKALICTSSLELGIDVGSADYVIQYNSPRSVARLIQRMGRAGHSVGGRTEGAIIASEPDELIEAMVISRRSMAGELEPLTVRPDPITVLANQMMAMTMTGAERMDDAFDLVRGAYPFRGLSREDFDRTIDLLASIRMLYVDGDSFRRSRRGMKYFYDNLSMIPDERTFLVRDLATRRIVGTLDESFVATFAEPFATFITRGRTWRILEIEDEELLVEQVNEIGSIPSWKGEDLPVPFSVAQEAGAVRRTGDLAPYPGDADAKARVTELVAEQGAAHPMPDDRLMTLEIGDRLAILNSCCGSRVNQTLAKLLSVLLTARLGEGVGIQTDPYRVILELPRNIGPKVIVDTLRSITPESLDGLVRMVMRNSTHLRWRFMYVAKKLGIVDRDADIHTVNLGRLFDVYEGTIAYDEALAKVIHEDLDLENAERVLAGLRDGTIGLEVTNVSPVGQAGLRQSKELIAPKRADRSILMALKKRLEDERLTMTCVSCRNQWGLRVRDTPKRVVCPRCGGRMVAALHPYNRDGVKLLGRDDLDAEQRKEALRLTRNANVVREHGRDAIIALAGRGVGPDTASRILHGYIEDEEDLLRGILEAEIRYARTKRFWD